MLNEMNSVGGTRGPLILMLRDSISTDQIYLEKKLLQSHIRSQRENLRVEEIEIRERERERERYVEERWKRGRQTDGG